MGVWGLGGAKPPERFIWNIVFCTPAPELSTRGDGGRSAADSGGLQWGAVLQRHCASVAHPEESQSPSQAPGRCLRFSNTVPVPGTVIEIPPGAV